MDNKKWIRCTAFRRNLPAAALIISIIAQTVAAQSPESVGMSSERLKRIHTAVEAAVKENKIPGAVTLVMRRGKTVYLDAVGMPQDTIFRIASMTKAVTSVAIMISQRGWQAAAHRSGVEVHPGIQGVSRLPCLEKTRSPSRLCRRAPRSLFAIC